MSTRDLIFAVMSTLVWGVIVFVRIERFQSRPWRVFSWAMFLGSAIVVLAALLHGAGLFGWLET
jgi:uncharacterized membrane protein